MPRHRFILPLACMFVLTGCVERTLRITSWPSGSIVWLNDQEVGRTPLEVSISEYGTYDVRLEKEGWEPLLAEGVAPPPWWDVPPLDLISEMLPIRLGHGEYWNYRMQPVRDDDAGLIERARELRMRLAEEEGGK